MHRRAPTGAPGDGRLDCQTDKTDARSVVLLSNGKQTSLVTSFVRSAMEKTDLRKWKLHVDAGRQVWKYHPDQKPEDQQAYDRYFLGLDTVRTGMA
jgi:hypothetical protein